MTDLKRIMHIEDDESIRMITNVTLDEIGNFEVLSCESGYEGIRQFADFAPQVILLDVMMPELDGPDTLEELKNKYDLSGVMVLFMTAKVQKEELEHFRAIGGFDVIEKPFDPMALADKIRAAWDSYNNRH